MLQTIEKMLFPTFISTIEEWNRNLLDLSILYKFLQLCTQDGLDCLPMIAETYGSWHPESLSALRTIAKRRSGRINQDFQHIWEQLQQKIAVLIQRSNANMIASLTPWNSTDSDPHARTPSLRSQYQSWPSQL